MKLSCVISLLLLAAFVYGYYVWLGQTFDGKELWIASFVVGLIATGGIGALVNSYLAWRDGSVLSDALIDLPRRDGKRTAVAGTLEPLGEPLVAPLSGRPSVLYEYDIYREVTRSKKGGGTETSKSVDFAGLGKTECIVRSTSTKLRLIGFPDLDPIAEEYPSEQSDIERARQYVQFTAWEDASGLGVFQGAHGMWSALTGSDEALRKDWRMIAVKECAWLQAESRQPSAMPAAEGFSDPARAAQAQQPQDEADEEFDDDEFEDDEFDDDDEAGVTWQDGSGYHPHLSEKRIEPGQQVVAIGRYDEVRQGLVSGGTQTIKIYLEDVQSVARKLASTKWSYLIGGILTLVIVNAGVWGAQQLYRNSDDAQRKWREELERAVRDGDVKTIDKLQKRGADLNAVRRPGDRPLLLSVRDPAIAKALIERGADVNAADQDGTTPLMQAVQNKDAAMVKLLIESQADLERKSKWGTTALRMAIESRDNEACVALLRNAGAKDDSATAENGEPIDESHEAFGVVNDYLAAVFAADPEKLRELSTPELGSHFAGVEFPTWQESRPTKPRLASGFVRGDDATLTVVGPNPMGSDRNWAYQLRRINGKWLVAREWWLD